MQITFKSKIETSTVSSIPNFFWGNYLIIYLLKGGVYSLPNPANSDATTKEPLHYKWEEKIALPIFIAHELPETKP